MNPRSICLTFGVHFKFTHFSLIIVEKRFWLKIQEGW